MCMKFSRNFITMITDILYKQKKRIKIVPEKTMCHRRIRESCHFLGVYFQEIMEEKI